MERPCAQPGDVGAEAVNDLLDWLLYGRVVGGGEGAAGVSAGFGCGLLAASEMSAQVPESLGHLVAMQLRVRLPERLEDAFRLGSVGSCLPGLPI